MSQTHSVRAALVASTDAVYAFAAMRTTALSDDSTLHETEKGAMRISHLAPDITSHVCVAHISKELAPIVIADGEKILKATGRCTFLVDAYDAKQHDTAFRDELTTWFKKHKDGRVTTNMLVHSKVLELAATVANLFSERKMIQVYSNLGDWDAACKRILPTYRREPLRWSRLR